MTPSIASLVDVTLERMLVAALIASPGDHERCGELAYQDFGDGRSAVAYEAFVNVLASGGWVTATTLCDELQKRHDLRGPHTPDAAVLGDQELRWLTDLMATPLPGDPPIAAWAAQVVVLAETRRAAIAAAEPAAPARPSRVSGPRAANAEPTRLAEGFRAWRYELDGEPTLVRWARAWWRYTGSHYVEIDDEILDRDIIGYLDVVVAKVADRKTGEVSLKRVTSRSKTIGEVRKALTFATPSLTSGAPQWTATEDGDPIARRVVACQNGLLDLDEQRLYPATPRFFSTTALGAPWDPDAPEPTAWLAFLDSLWGEDKESIRALQQMFGYFLTADTSHQKLFALIGPPRSGKGTIARVLRALLGAEAVTNPTLKSLEEPFGLAPLVGKTLAVVGDARLGGKTDQAQIVERLLSISGEDDLSVNRKNRDAVNVRLTCRVLLLSNDMPRLYDTSGALASRFVLVKLSRSWLGSEDTGLEQRLIAELPGILRWAVAGHSDLAESGRFVRPLASEDAMQQLREVSSPIRVFLDECCEVGPDERVDVDDLYARYRKWAEVNGSHPDAKAVFGSKLHDLLPALARERYTHPTGRSRRYRYSGISILD